VCEKNHTWVQGVTSEYALGFLLGESFWELGSFYYLWSNRAYL